ncbi:MAG: hypothetical protein SR3Q1_10430 [Quinella sp. 3Q1]|nr:hypothetical protein [Quinella sp. 3Q1]MBR6887483.1 hypothetical protein [Selenomonadaceae bacterium]
MNYVFVFLGEFGYELFNWQGLVRKFKTTCSPEDIIIIGGRTGMDIWYPYADIFIDISADPFYKASRADGYFAYDIATLYRKDSQDAIKASVQAYITEKLRPFNIERPEFIFSSDLNLINGVHFGMWEKFFNIYGGEGHKQNLYAKIDYDSAELKSDLENRLQINLSEPYVLVQGRKRDIVIRSKHVVPTELLVEKLAEKIPVVVLNFNTGRAWDSRSEIAGGKNCRVLKSFSAHEQAILIKHAADCVFTTENDFGSHIYVPPFMGRDVLAIAGADVYTIGTTPIDFWNGEIFKFGGQILPFVSEEIFASEAVVKGFCEVILKRISANYFFGKLEEKAATVDIKDFYLWPNTPPPPDSREREILQRVGVSDYDTNDPRSRSSLIIDCLGKLIRGGKISYPFVLADICGGDAIVGTKIKEHFMLSEVIVQDCFKGKFSTHKQAHERGVKLYGGWLQHLVEGDLANKIDVVLMLNTFRGWHSAQLRPNEQDIPMKTLLWFERNSKFFIVTATVDQIKFLEQRGFTIVLLGKGEDDSYMICVSKNF